MAWARMRSGSRWWTGRDLDVGFQDAEAALDVCKAL
jgi:hypothetical protein